jgi:hypothetical protein
VATLRYGRISWKPAGQTLDRGASRCALTTVIAHHRACMQSGARKIAAKAGMRRIANKELPSLNAPDRTVCRFDVRTLEEFQGGYFPGCVNVPGEQLVQETDRNARVRGARMCWPTMTACADMSASWLAQVGWKVSVVDLADAKPRYVTGAVRPSALKAEDVVTVTPHTLASWLKDAEENDIAASAIDVKRHTFDAWFVIRAQL